MKNRMMILVVDDEPRNLRLMEAMLLPLGYDAVLANGGAEGLAKLGNLPVDLVLLDLKMPGMDGFEVLRQIRADPKTAVLPVVVVTAHWGSETKVQALEAGADDFLSKPVDKAEMRARVKSLLRVKMAHDNLSNYRTALEKTVVARTEELRCAMVRVEEASLDIIHRLARAAEYRDDDTGAHLERMSRFAAAVAAQMGLSKKEVRDILHASPMHDVGKIGIPDRILLKPGRLSTEERAIMERHVELGVRILEGSEYELPQLAERIIATHHERFDGTGYPKGLSGDDIPIEGRIVAIADVFDALISKRPYKEAKPAEECLRIIYSLKGNHFDPRVVDAFIEVWDEILDINSWHQDDGVSALHRLSGDHG
ncbi:MAG: response regulator [Proteobacteria bacterium]|jgi:putative two-component system response regulator|nr:response regulator [Pseudomonadota bacterium]